MDIEGSVGASTSKPTKNVTLHKKINDGKPATFEEAIIETKFGKLNLALIAIAIPTSLCSVFETTTMSYVLSAAQCDLNLSLTDKGLLNSITYAGMISSAIVWGFLFDVLGRRKLLSVGFLCSGLCVVMTAFSSNIAFLMVFKFLGGFIVNGPSAAMSSYLTEFHSAKYRPSMQMIIGTVNALAAVLLPSLAWLILPRELDYSFFNNTINIHSWNVFLLVASLPALTSGLIFFFMPESPKYLMTIGENDQALKIFQWVYSLNTGKTKESYPIKKLIDETKLNENNKHGGHVTRNRTTTQALKEGFQQIKPLFFKPYLSKIALVGLICVCTFLSYNSLRLWFPHIYQAAEDYALAHNGTSASLCIMIEESVSKPEAVEECVVNMNNSMVYITSITNGCVMVLGLISAGTLIHFTGKKPLQGTVCILASSCCFGLYFSQNTTTTTILTSIFTTCGSISVNVMAAVCVDMFPTTLRTLSISLSYMTGRTAAMIGNLIFPFLLESGCGPPFFVGGGMMLAAGILSIIIPNTDNKAMQ